MPDNIRYLAWKRCVDIVVAQVTGMGCDDGFDWPSRACYDAGMSAGDAACVWAKEQDVPGLLEAFERKRA